MRMEEEERECRMHALHRVYQPRASARTREPESVLRAPVYITWVPYCLVALLILCICSPHPHPHAQTDHPEIMWYIAHPLSGRLQNVVRACAHTRGSVDTIS